MRLPITMRALQQNSFDGPQDMRLVHDAPVPRPGAAEVLIRVRAAGVNFADVSRSYGTFGGGPRPPYTAGFEAVGEVIERGSAVTDPGLGVLVAGIGNGAFAEYMTLPAATAVPVPPGWTPEQALGLGVNWPAALAALRTLGRVSAGETVLIHAAAGATGQAAVTLARHYGARVIAVAAASKHETVLALGAEHVVESGDADLVARVRALTGGAGADLVLECAGGDTFARSLAAARPVTGRVVVYGLAGGEAIVSNWELVYRNHIQLIGCNVGVLARSAPRLFGALKAELSELIRAEVLTPVRPVAFDLADGPKALAGLAARTTVGKLALLP
ncbi:zinc-binding dehydrogenase [Nocardia sp. NPDC005978]|uniref:zinc-binding dehydrogenase n=1 Tax=Nocardia sp. NPDC005978 TaxID=3156725 RepID=UPI0033A9DB5C